MRPGLEGEISYRHRGGRLILIGGAAWAVGTPQLVSQKDQIFNPGK